MAALACSRLARRARPSYADRQMSRFWGWVGVGAAGFVLVTTVVFTIRSIVDGDWVGILVGSTFLVLVQIPLTWMAWQSHQEPAP